MKIYPTRSSHDWLVASETVPGLRYETTRHSCTCQGFQRYGKPGWTCKHIRAVREAHGDPVIVVTMPATVEQPQTAA